MANRIPPVVLGLFAVEALLGLLHVLFAAIAPDLHPGLNHLFNLYREQNIPTWFSSVQLALVGVLFAGFAWTQHTTGRPAWAMALAALGFLFLSLDEVAEIHEKIGVISDVLLPGGDRANTVFRRSGIWMFLLGPLLLIAFAAWWKSATQWFAGFPGRGRFVTGMLVFVAAATVPEILNNFNMHPALHTALVLLEELGEMAGVTLLLWTTWELCLFHIPAGGQGPP